MDAYKLRCDTNFWNLDALEFQDKPNAKGTIALRTIKADLGFIKRIAVINGPLLDQNGVALFLRPENRVIQGFTISPHPEEKEFRTPREEAYVDMAVEAGNLYLLTERAGRRFITRFQPLKMNIRPKREWILEVPAFTSATRLQISVNQQSTVAYIGPCVDKQFLCVELGESPQAIARAIPISLADSLGSELNFSVDSQTGTLVIADTQNHRVVEVDSVTGEASVICGTGKPGNARECEVSNKAALNLPAAVAVYRPSEVINKGLLKSPSETFFTGDPKNTRPRTILIADSGNFRVKKMVELPSIASLNFNLPTEPFIYTLIGTGTEIRGTHRKISYGDKSDLRKYPIPRPTDLSVTASGDLLIGCQTNQTFIFLRPSTSLSKEVSEQIYRDSNISKP